MPPKGYKSISIKESIYNELQDIMREKALISINDAIAILLDYRDIYSRLAKLVDTCTAREVEKRLSQAGEQPRQGQEGDQSGSQPRQGQRRHKGFMDILAETGYSFLSDLEKSMKIRSREKFLQWARSQGAIVLEAPEGDHVIIHRSYWPKFLEALGAVDDISMDKAKKVLGEKEYKLFEALVRTGYLYFDSKTRKWVPVEVDNQ